MFGLVSFRSIVFPFISRTCKYHVIAIECQLVSGTALGSKRHPDTSGTDKGQKQHGSHQQHQKSSQVSKLQLKSKVTLKGTRNTLTTIFKCLFILLFLNFARKCIP